MTEWFVQRAGDVDGPLRPADLLKLVRSGAVKPETKIRKGDSAWFEASQVGGLFEAAMRPTIEIHCPSCNAVLESVPCECPGCGQSVLHARTRIIENTISNGQEANSAKPSGGRSVQRWLARVRKKNGDT